MATLLKKKQSEIKEHSFVTINKKFVHKYPEHNEKIFKVLEIDEEHYCELEWINAHAKERIIYVHKDHLTISS